MTGFYRRTHIVFLHHHYSFYTKVILSTTLEVRFVIFVFCVTIYYSLFFQGSSDSEDDRSSLSKLRVDVRMIDFAHVYPAENGQIDTNYVFGLNNLIQIFEILALSEDEKSQINLPSSSSCQTQH